MHDRRRARHITQPGTILGRWWFLGCVAVLAVNDHVLKRTHPGPVTGKVSDVVGPVVVATLLALIVGRTAAVTATAVGFVALKTVPGVAELAAPILGGVTRRDPGDLVGLLALPLLWWVLDPVRPAAVVSPQGAPAAGAVVPRSDAGRPADRTGRDTRPRRSGWPGHAGLASTLRRLVLPITGAVTATLALTATSATGSPEVESLAVVDGVVYAELVDHRTDDKPSTWAWSTDGGHTWEPHEGEPLLDRATMSTEEACLGDGRCVAARGDSVEVREPGGDWSTSFAFNENQREVLEYRRYGGGPPIEHLFSTVVVVDTPEGESVVVGSRDQGVLVMDDDTPWERIDVLDAEATPTGGAMWPLDLMTTFVFASLPLGIVAVVIRAIIGSRNPWTVLGSIVGALLIAFAIWILGIGAWAFGTFSAQNPVLLAAVLGVLGLATIALPLAFVREVEAEVPEPV